MSARPRSSALLAPLLATAIACAGAPPPTSPAPAPRSGESATTEFDRAAVVRTATAMIGAPYRYGGSSPRGFDCSGLVVYSYARAGVYGLPHSAAALERRSRRVAISELEPGDLLFFRLGSKKTSHVGLYVGNRSFVHAPSSGKRVESVSFDHVYWSSRLRLAGLLVF